jgi:hypothetical protein
MRPRVAPLLPLLLWLSLSASLWLTVGRSVLPVGANPTGAPSATCASGAASQKPDHGSGTWSTAANPYVIQLADGATQYAPGATISVTLSGAATATKFMGFMVSAFKPADTAGATRLGSFTATTGAKTMCTSKAATQSSNSLRLTQTVSFVAPPAGTGTIALQATMLKAMTSFWKMPQLLLTEAGAAPGPTPTPGPAGSSSGGSGGGGGGATGGATDTSTGG